MQSTLSRATWRERAANLAIAVALVAALNQVAPMALRAMSSWLATTLDHTVIYDGPGDDRPGTGCKE